MTVVMVTMSFRYTGELNLRFGPKTTLIPAMAFIVAGLLLLAHTPVDASYAIDLLPAMLLFGLGAGVGFPSLMTLAMSGATESDSGLASGLVNISVQVGGAIGLAVLATFATERTDRLLADGESAVAALNSGFHLAYLIGAGLVLVAIAVAVSVLRSPEPEAAAEPATEVTPEPGEGTPLRRSPCRPMPRPRAAAASRPACE
jgi:MFS family permease